MVAEYLELMPGVPADKKTLDVILCRLKKLAPIFVNDEEAFRLYLGSRPSGRRKRGEDEKRIGYLEIFLIEKKQHTAAVIQRHQLHGDDQYVRQTHSIVNETFELNDHARFLEVLIKGRNVVRRIKAGKVCPCKKAMAIENRAACVNCLSRAFFSS